MNDLKIRLILCNLRGAGNVGSILRTADAAGVELVYVAGYTPYPRIPGDDRPPHVISSNDRAIAKTALGAERTMHIVHSQDSLSAVAEAKLDGFNIIVIEQAETSLNLFRFAPTSQKVALVLGNEIEGVELLVLLDADSVLEIPMRGRKESLGVAVAAGIAMYRLRTGPSPT